jgi:gas vesicle protein
MSKNNGSKWAIGALFLGVTGFIAGILAAPKSGKETREDIKDTANRVVTEIEKDLKKVHVELGDLVTQVKKIATAKTGIAKKEASAAVDVAKLKQAKVKELLTAVRDGGESENPELQKALKEAKSAINHLKKFVK